MIDAIRSSSVRKEILKYISYGENKNIEFIKQNIPSKLYRYRGLNSYTLDELERGYAYGSSPVYFNDIFDSRDNSIWSNNSNNTKLLMLKDDGKEYFNNCAKKTVHRFEYMMKILRIACFSENNNSTLMWSHYSENHTGICIEYNFFNKTREFQKHIFPVNYIENPVDTSKLKQVSLDECKYKHEIDILISALTKSKDWEYEHEWRIIIGFVGLDKDIKGIEILMPKPTKIILGSKFFEKLNYSNKENRSERLEFTKRLLNFVKDNNIKLSIMFPQIGTYKYYEKNIDIQEISDIILNENSYFAIKNNINSYINKLQIEQYVVEYEKTI